MSVSLLHCGSSDSTHNHQTLSNRAFTEKQKQKINSLNGETHENMKQLCRRSSLSEWSWKILWWGRRRWWWWWRVNAAVDVERIEELVVRAADEAGEEFVVDCRHADYEVLLGQDCVKIIRSHHVRGDREPGNISNSVRNNLLL